MERVLARRLRGLVPESKTGLERLIDKKRESYDLQVVLDQKKEQHSFKMKQFKARAEELERKNLQNQQEVLEKNQYVTDNANKKLREEDRLQSEQKLLNTKNQELKTLQQTLVELKAEYQEKQEQLKLAEPYKKYLDRVFEAAPEITTNGSVNDVQCIVMKYKTLIEWRGTLQLRLLNQQKELQRLRDAIAQYDESSTNYSVEIDYQIKCLAQKQDESFKAFGRQRHMQETMAQQNTQKAAEAAVIRLSIENMYHKAIEASIIKRGRDLSENSSLIKKFNFVKNLILDMKEIEEACTEQ